jgi:Tol biopolymer transport system component
MLKSMISRFIFRFVWATIGSTVFAITLSAQPVNISGGTVTSCDVTSYGVSADGRYAVFVADKHTDGVFELYSTDLSTGVITKISGGLVSGGDVIDFKISPDSARVVFVADKVADSIFDLYSAPINGSTVPVNLSGPSVGGTSVFQISPDSTRVVFAASSVADNVLDLYSVPIAGGAPPLNLSERLVSGGGGNSILLNFQISADGARVVFVADKLMNQVFEIYSAPITGGVVPLNLSGPLVSGGDAFEFKVSPDSARVVFRGDKVTDNVTELYSIPIDGAAAPVNLSGLLVSGGLIAGSSFQISPDSARVVFRADKATDGVDELYSVPINGGSAPMNLSGPLVSGGSVANFLISPDSAHVVFQADKAVDTVVELYSVPIDGGAAPANLSRLLISGGAVRADFRISPDSARVVLVADKVIDEVFELYSVPINASAAPLNLSGPLVSGGNVRADFRISPDNARVVFLADKVTVGVDELYSVPIDGSAAPVNLSGPLVNGGDAFGFQISPDSARVVFRADKVADGVDELFRVQIGGVALALDIDGDDKVLPDTDLLLLARYQIGIRGNELISNALGANATITGAIAIQSRIRAALGIGLPSSGTALALDIDGDDRVLPLTDLLLLTRYRLGMRGSALIQGALGANATITGATAIESRIRAALGAALPF